MNSPHGNHFRLFVPALVLFLWAGVLVLISHAEPTPLLAGLALALEVSAVAFIATLGLQKYIDSAMVDDRALASLGSGVARWTHWFFTKFLLLGRFWILSGIEAFSILVIAFGGRPPSTLGSHRLEFVVLFFTLVAANFVTALWLDTRRDRTETVDVAHAMDAADESAS